MARRPPAQSDDPQPQLIAGRYAVESCLGHGGVGTVYAVIDTSNGAKLALKQLRADAGEHAAALFDREYRTLAGLHHPCIVRVFEYGLAEPGPYYTMERLSGRDLSGRAPIPWRTACAYLRDAAAILGLLHARRLLYRDLSPRNLIEHTAGRLKLIDFGALADFGPSVEVAGTPAYMPPEALERAALDQRSDLFALGALGYWMITGSNAFPARTLEELPRMWQHEPAPVSTVVQAIGSDLLEVPPPQLDELFAQLLRVDPEERVTSTAELIDRLTIIAGLAPEAANDAVAAYLHSSAFVGREKELAYVGEALKQAAAGRGQVILIQAEPGLGRSRLLNELALSARLAGAVTWISDAASGRRAYALARSLLAQLQRALPNEAAHWIAPYAQELAPLLSGRAGALAEPSFGEARARLQRALLAVFSAAAKSHCCVLLIDDLHTIDEESRALLNALAHRASELKLCLVASLAIDSRRDQSPAIVSMRGAATTLQLQPLTAAETRALLCSVFGEVPYLDRLSERWQRISQGNPGHCLELAQELVDAGTAYYLEGRWNLPMELTASIAPQHRHSGLAARLEQLPAAARALARVMSVPHQVEWTSEQLAWAAALPDAQITEPIGTLLRERVLTQHKAGYGFAHPELQEKLYAELHADQRREIHARLGRALLETAARDDISLNLCACLHLIRAADLDRAYPLLKRVLEQCANGDPARIGSHAQAFEEVYLLLEQAQQDEYALCGPLGMLAVSGYFNDRRYALRYGSQAIQALERVLYSALARRLRPWLGHKLSFFLALGVAAIGCIRRRRSCVSLPLVVRLLLLAASTLAGTAAICMDPDRAGRYARSLEPLTAFGSNHAASFVYAFTALMEQQGRDYPARCVAAYRKMIARLEDPRPIRELDQQVRSSYYAGVHLTLGVFLVRRDDQDGLRVADKLEQFSPLYAMSADHLRANYYAAQGELNQAQAARSLMEVHAVQLGSAWQVETWAPVDVINIAWRLSDAAEMKRAVQELKRLSAEVPSLAHQALYAQIGYLVLRGQYSEALQLYESVEDPPYAMNGWIRNQGAIARAHNALGQHRRARDICTRALAEADSEERQYVVMNLGTEIELALAEAGLGNFELAHGQLSDLLVQHSANASAVTLGALHEARCRVSLQQRDLRAARKHLQAAYLLYRSLGVASLLGRVRTLERELDDAMQPMREAVTVRPGDPRGVQRLKLLLRRRANENDRARSCIEAVLELSQAEEALLVFSDSTLQAGVSEISEEVVTWARRKLAEPPEDADTVVIAKSSAAEGPGCLRIGETQYRATPLWSQHDNSDQPFVVLVLGSKRGVPERLAPEVSKLIADELD